MFLRGTAMLVMALAAAPAAGRSQATVGGVIVDRTTQGPVEGVRVAVLGAGRAVATDSAGRFELSGLPAGIRVLQARAVGYLVGSWLVELSDGQAFRGTFELEARPVTVAGVTVRADPSDWRSEAAFEQRRLTNRGFYFTREDIRHRQPATISDLTRTVPGLLTACNSRGCTVLMERSRCRPEYYLDGHPATFATGPNFPINVATIRGVEVYRSENETPIEFQRIGLTCGVIAIWTIEPGEDLDRPVRP